VRKADLRLILRRRILACDDHAVEGCSEASAAASWSDDVSRPALERAHEQDYNVHDEAKRGRRFGRRQALHLYIYIYIYIYFISCLCCGSFLCSAVHFIGEHSLSVQLGPRHCICFSSSAAEAAVDTPTSPTLGRSCVI